jgi:DNA polymerase (family 10)
MTNEQIAKQLKQLADLLEFTGANPFRLRAYRNGSRVIAEMTDSIATLVRDGADLTQFDGVGKGVAQKCKELVETGNLEQLDQLLEEVPKSVLNLLNIPGLGPKKAAVLFNELNITTLDALKAACEAGELQKLSGFGEKTEIAILEGIAFAATAGNRILWAEADQIARQLAIHMTACPKVKQMEFAGSYRRGKETIGDLDLLVDTQDGNAVMDHFMEFDRVQSVLVRGESKLSVRLDDDFQIDLRVVPRESFGAALQYFTGSKEHNVRVRGMAKQMDMKVNEWGVYEVDKKGNEKWIAGKTEKEVYAALGMPLFHPETREDRREFEWAEKKRVPQLVQEEDILGDLHMHTTATDGKNSIEEMAETARARGLRYIVITDHSKRVAMANGLDGKRAQAQWRKIDKLNEKAKDDFLILKGIECDILENGDMDLSDSVLAKADFVIASLHYGQKQPRQQITDRITGALANPHVCMVAHPTGRLINKRDAYDVDLDAVFQAAVEHGKLMELNANPMRLDLNDVYLLKAKTMGIPIVINTDAHSVRGLKNMKFGIKQARRGYLTKKDVANTREWAEMKALIGK